MWGVKVRVLPSPLEMNFYKFLVRFIFGVAGSSPAIRIVHWTTHPIEFDGVGNTVLLKKRVAYVKGCKDPEHTSPE